MTWSTNDRAAATYAARHAAPQFERMNTVEAFDIIREGLGDIAEATILGGIADLKAFLASTSQKVGDDWVLEDVAERGSLNCALAILWAHRTVSRDGRRTFAYVAEMSVAANGRGLSAGQVRGLVNCMRAEALRDHEELLAAAPFGDEPEDAPVQAGEFASVVEHMQRLAGSLSRPKVRLAENVVLSIAGQRSRFPGSIVVSDGQYGGVYHGRINLDGTTANLDRDGRIIEVLRAFAQDPEAALATYGRLTGQCAICGRLLENVESVARGIGPICAGRMGL